MEQLAAGQRSTRALPIVLASDRGRCAVVLELLDRAIAPKAQDRVPMALAAWCRALRGFHRFTSNGIKNAKRRFGWLNQDGQIMRLYYHPLSSNSRRVLLTAHHLGFDLELVAVDLLRGEHKTPEFLRLNPNGKIPILVDRGFQLWESHAIMQYLADKSPEQDLYPQDVSARADVNRWLFWSAYHFAPAAGFIIRERVSKRIMGGSAAPDPLEIARGEALLPATALVLDRHLAGKQWIAQDRLTLADFAIAAPLMHTSAAQLPVTEFENLQAWFARVQSLDAWAKSSV